MKKTFKEISKKLLRNNKYNLYICKDCCFMTDQSHMKRCLACGSKMVKREGTLKKDFK